MGIREIESYFPYDGTYLDATIHNWGNYWRFTIAWQHTELRESIDIESIPSDTALLERMAIQRYERHKWQNALQNMNTNKGV